MKTMERGCEEGGVRLAEGICRFVCVHIYIYIRSMSITKVPLLSFVLSKMFFFLFSFFELDPI